MVTLNDQMTITEYGLHRISEELINEREFDPSKIIIIGTPAISVTGALSELNETRAAEHSGLYFTEDDSIQIVCRGVLGGFSTSDFSQCLWCLKGSTNISLNLQLFGDESIKLMQVDSTGTPVLETSIFTLEPEKMSPDSEITISVSLSKNSYKYNYNIDGNIGEGSGVISPNIDLSIFNTVLIGNDRTYESSETFDTHNFWRGSIGLSHFMIYKNDNLYYAPSNAVYFTFSHLAIGDGTYPLSDSSQQVNRRVYFFPIEEIARTNNNILLRTTISKDATLIIREIGLYINVEGNLKLFSVLKGLNIQKTSDLDYELMFKVNLNVSVVSLNVFPEIEIDNSDNMSKKDFNLVKEDTFGTFADLEVASAKNATEIGYNKAQVFYKKSDEINLDKENWIAAQSYFKLCSKIKNHTETTFNFEVIEKHGNVNVTTNGVASNFSNDNYVLIQL